MLLTQYCNFCNKIYRNIFSSSRNNNNNNGSCKNNSDDVKTATKDEDNSAYQATLDKFNYFDVWRFDGTLLHCVVENNHLCCITWKRFTKWKQQANEEENDESQLSDMRSIEDSSKVSIEQIIFVKYFLMYMDKTLNIDKYLKK